MSLRKRPAEAIDLTNDDGSDIDRDVTPQPAHPPLPPGPRPKLPRLSPSSTSRHASQCYAAGSSQLNPLTIDDEDEDAGAEEVPDASQSFNEDEARFSLYGTMASKIVGVRYYDGVATVGEMVILRREPHNQYDRNAIQVLNVQGVQIGHIPRTIAAKLAKYMDSRKLLPEGTITGHKGAFDCPIEVKLYGTNEPVARSNLLSEMKADKLPTGHGRDRARKEEREKKERQKLAQQAARFAKKHGGTVVGVDGQQFTSGMGEFAASSSAGLGLGPSPSLEDIVSGSERFNPRNVNQTVEKFGVKEEDLMNLPSAAQPEGIITKLHPFQLQGLQWMLDKEDPQLPAQGSKDIVQLWQRHPTMRNAFTNLATCFSITNPELASGGILADDMGLGKTIQMISLIIADRTLKRKIAGACDSTLILAPVSVMSNWATQVKKHVKENHALRVMIYHGTRKEQISPAQIANYDVVISTYETIASEWQKSKTKGPFSVKWRRIVLDEAHQIRSPKAKRTVAVSQLQAQSRWALTGTPIINTLKDLYSLVRFLRLSGGLDKFEIFHSAVIRPVQLGEDRGNKALQLLMRDICLRRKKEHKFIDLRLPELSEYVHKIDFFPHEKEKYDALEAQAKGNLDLYRQAQGKKSNKGLPTYQHLLEILLRMRQVCNHWKLVGEERLESVMQQLEAEGVVDLTEENRAALQSMLKLSIESQEDCPICLDPLQEPVITRCAHVFCTICIERVIDIQHKCPMCRAELESLATTTVKPAKEAGPPSPPTQEELLDRAVLEKNSSSKVEGILSILKASAKDSTNKTIIFSQWTSFLNILQHHLTAAGFTYTRIDGSMNALQRDAALESFDTDHNTTIMLASLAVCSVGLNLVAANQVIMSDSWWAPAIEDQAVDRVHRLGQLRETTVFRLVIQGSVEERVLGIQEEKRKLMGLAFAEREVRKGKKKDGARGLADLEKLLGDGDGSGNAGRA